MTGLVAEIEQRWKAQFTALAGGADVAPTDRLRLEGLMEAAVLTGETDPSLLTERMQAMYTECFGRAPEDDFGDDWRTLFPFPQIPAMATRAPVVPTTKD